MELLAIYAGALLVLLAFGIHVATTLFLLGLIGAFFYLGPTMVLTVGTLAWSTLNDFILVAIPLFILLGEILLRSGLADRMYTAIAVWLNWLPGGLLHTNIGACALFAATSGSSVATAATIGTVALPTFKERGYNERLVLGSIAAGGTLGILIPPSINMIIYGAMTDTSIGRLFLAGIVPGLVLTLFFMGMILVLALLHPERGGRAVPIPLGEKLRRLKDLLPPLVIFAVVMGGIYLGWATPTEAAALGVVAALVLAGLAGGLSVEMLHEAFKSTLRTTAMVMLIIVAAFFLNFVISLLGLPQQVTAWVRDLGISPAATMLVLVLIYLVLGCMLETLSMMITTIPIVVPLVVSLGYDPVWFGIFLTILMELALITPPVGVNLYVVQGIRPPGSGSINDVILGTLPFLAAMLGMLALLFFLPDLALWLPSKLFVSAS